MLTFQPKTEEELKKSVLLPKGDYEFEVTGAEDATSKSGNPMIKLTLKVYGPDGNTTTVFDYLLAAIEYKLKHFCDSTGLRAEYEAGMLTADMCSNRPGRCSLKIESDKTGKYDDKNVVTDYIPRPSEPDDTPF